MKLNCDPSHPWGWPTNKVGHSHRTDTVEPIVSDGRFDMKHHNIVMCGPCNWQMIVPRDYDFYP